MKIENNVLIEVNETDIIDGVFENHDVTEVSDSCFLQLPSLKKVVLPKVVKIGDNCFSNNYSLTDLELPLLQSAREFCFSINISLINLNLPLLQKAGNSCFTDNKSLTDLDLPSFQSAGEFCFSDNYSLTSLNLPLLQTVGEFCFTESKSLTSLNLPLLQTVGEFCFRGNISLTSLNLPLLQTTGNYCFKNNTSLTNLDLPSLKTAGNYCFRNNNSLTSINISGQNLNHLSVDGFPFIIQSEKKVNDYTVYSGYNFNSIENLIISKDECFVANKDNYFAHGTSIKKAIEDLEFKILTNKLKKEPIQKDTMFTVKYYRALTGACDHGVRSWMKSNNIPFEVIINEDTHKEETKELTPIKAIDLMPMLEQTNAYGYEKFKSLITW